MRRDVFNALADPTRRSILMSLTVEPQNLNTLAEKFEISRQAVSLHVKYLNQCGVVTINKKGRERYCDLNLEKISEAAEWLEPFKKLWEARFKELDKVLSKLNSKKENTL